jgi:hypothetical protein
VVAAIVVVGLSVLLTALLLPRPQETAAQPTPAATPAPSPSASPDRAAADEQHRQYRAYVTTVLTGGASVIASMSGLESCRTSRAACLTALDDASQQVSSLDQDLASTPAPPCLSAANEKLEDAVSFWERGLSAAHDAVQTQNRVQLVQGVLLTTAGNWRAGQAIVSARQSDC